LSAATPIAPNKVITKLKYFSNVPPFLEMSTILGCAALNTTIISDINVLEENKFVGFCSTIMNTLL
jgi:hypothetical protein